MDDRQPLPLMARGLVGKLIGEKGYLSQLLLEQLLQQGLHLITPIRNNMANRLLPFTDKLLQRKRAITETINAHLKNISQIEHSRHRSPTNFLVNLVAGLLASCHQLKKPAVRFGTDTPVTDMSVVIPNWILLANCQLSGKRSKTRSPGFGKGGTSPPLHQA